MTPPIEFAHVPSRHKPARKRALLFWLAVCAVALASAALMVLPMATALIVLYAL